MPSLKTFANFQRAFISKDWSKRSNLAPDKDKQKIEEYLSHEFVPLYQRTENTVSQSQVSIVAIIANNHIHLTECEWIRESIVV